MGGVECVGNGKNQMKRLSFRQWIAYTVVVAMFFNMAAPLGICWCDGCSCDKNFSKFLPDWASANEKCCCTSLEPQSDDKCCGSPETPCSCPCGDILKNNTTIPAVLPDKLPHWNPMWNVVAVLPSVSVDNVSKVPSYRDRPRTLFHVPLHILLCVFLN